MSAPRRSSASARRLAARSTSSRRSSRTRGRAARDVVLGARGSAAPADGKLEALSAVCPHLGCAVGWDAGASNFLCPCHDSRFDDRRRACPTGPAKRGLDPLPIEIKDGRLRADVGALQARHRRRGSRREDRRSRVSARAQSRPASARAGDRRRPVVRVRVRLGAGVAARRRGGHRRRARGVLRAVVDRRVGVGRVRPGSDRRAAGSCAGCTTTARRRS